MTAFKGERQEIAAEMCYLYHHGKLLRGSGYSIARIAQMFKVSHKTADRMIEEARLETYQGTLDSASYYPRIIL